MRNMVSQSSFFNISRSFLESYSMILTRSAPSFFNPSHLAGSLVRRESRANFFENCSPVSKSSAVKRPVWPSAAVMHIFRDILVENIHAGLHLICIEDDGAMTDDDAIRNLRGSV